jgi:H+/Cl- antiporter ClcA
VPKLPAYDGTNLLDLGLAVPAGVVTALLIVAIRRLGAAVREHGERRLGAAIALVAGGVVVGALALLASRLGADPEAVLFSGQAAVPYIVAADSVSIVLLVIAVKGIAYGVSLGCGFRGGPIFPAIFLGVAVTALAVVTLDVSPTLAVAVGTAAGMAAMTRLLFSGLVFATLLVGAAGLDAMPAAVLAAVAAWLTVTALDRRGAGDAPDPAARGARV